MQCSAFSEEKQKNQLAQTQFRFISSKSNEKGREKIRAILRFYIRVALQQQTADFKVAIFSRPMQWSSLTEAKQKN